MAFHDCNCNNPTCSLSHPDREMKEQVLGKLNKFDSSGSTQFTRDHYNEEFAKITKQMSELSARKNSDYGGLVDPFKNFREFGAFGIVVRMGDKWARIKSALVEKRDLKVLDETIEDTILDLAVYCVILLVWRRSKQDERNK